LTDRVRSQEDRAMDRYAEGDNGALSIVYDAIAPRVFGFLIKRTRDEQLAEDLLQQTFLHIHRARGTFIAGSEVAPWAFSIARRLLIDSARASKRRRAVLSSDVSVDAADGTQAIDETLALRELGAQVFKLLEALPSNQREAFEMIRLDGLSIREAASAIGATEASVKLRAHRAYKALGLSEREKFGEKS
jgi:RNA polymerase sigma-70 factor, ECF subfamily